MVDEEMAEMEIPPPGDSPERATAGLELTELRLLVEARDRAVAPLVHEALRADLGIRVDVVPVAVGSLPRWDLKAQRVVSVVMRSS